MGNISCLAQSKGQGVDSWAPFFCIAVGTNHVYLYKMIRGGVQTSKYCHVTTTEMPKDERRVTSNSQVHILAIPIPAQGHMNPMIQFCKRLGAKGLKVMLLLASSVQDAAEGNLPPCDVSDSLSIRYISDGFNNLAKMQRQMDEDMAVFGRIYSAATKRSFTEFIQSPQEWENRSKVILYDAQMSWVLNIAHELGFCSAAFVHFSCAVACIYNHANEGDIKIPVEEPVSLPALPLLEARDMPSFISDADSYQAMGRQVLNTFSSLKTANWVFINTLDALEDQVLKWMAGVWRIKVIGPTVPSKYLDKQLIDDIDYSFHLAKPDMAPSTATAWLDTQQIASVVYASFGSMANLTEQQTLEIASALDNSNCPFIWAVREQEQKNLPTDFKQKISNQGLILSWCSQLEVLNHPAVGCFLTHCGWNSVLEAISSGVPMVAMPQWTDQHTNAKYIQDVWKVGIRVNSNHPNKKLIPRQEINRCISEIMEGSKKSELLANSTKWKKLSQAAMDKCGSANKNIDQFVQEVLSIP